MVLMDSVPENGSVCIQFTGRAVAFMSSAMIRVDLFFTETLRDHEIILSQEKEDVYKNVMLILSSLQLNLTCLFLYNSSNSSSVV